MTDHNTQPTALYYWNFQTLSSILSIVNTVTRGAYSSKGDDTEYCKCFENKKNLMGVGEI